MSYHDRIIIWGMSCVGKTTFAGKISKATGSKHICFDAHFPWHDIETLGFAPSVGLVHVNEVCSHEAFVVDGWHLSDGRGKHFPKDVFVYILVARYDQIISQYRVPVDHSDQHLNMFKKWYCDPDFTIFPNVRYWNNTGDFVEITREDFMNLSSSQVRNQ